MLQSRMFLRRVLVGLLLAALFTYLALRPQPTGRDDARLVERQFLAMGTLVSVSTYLDPAQDRMAVESALQSLETFLREFELRWAAWGDGTLGTLNQQLAQGQAVEIPKGMQGLFDLASRLGAESDGAFDVRVGSLVRLWGFDDEAHFRTEPPAPAAILQLAADLQAAPPLVEGATHYGPAPVVQFDFGAIAKGRATDLAVGQLRKAGIRHAIVNAGGNLRSIGQHGDRPWRIGIRHPRPEAGERILATLEAQEDEAIITSGDYERFFEYGGSRFHHILDPRGGYPATGLQAVTVVHADGAVADAASTALFVAGPDGWRAMAQRLGLTQVLVVDAQGRSFVTPVLAPRLKFTSGVKPKIAAIEPATTP